MDTFDKELSLAYRAAIGKDACFYCGDQGAATYHNDHYVSLYNGGTDHWWNLVRACGPCNHRKNKMNGDEFLALIAA